MATEITMNHICKIEGHAHLSLRIKDGEVKTCKLKASEGARFFEALVVNKKLEDVQEIVSRICGICSCSHSVASIKGLEEALGIKPSNQQKFIWEMLMLGERIRSHATHLYFLALPDYYNASSALTLGKEHKSKIDDALKLVTLGNTIAEDFGGREMHPFLKVKENVPDVDFSKTLNALKESKKNVLKTIDLFAGLKYPNLERSCDYLCLSENSFYAIISGKVASREGKFIDDDYKKHLSEGVKEYATSKFVLKDGEPYMLGAMARINNNVVRLDSETKKVFEDTLKKMKLKMPLTNPYHNLICQAIELMQTVNRAIYLLENVPKFRDSVDFEIREGHGVSASEAPRGTLFHEYKLDSEGRVTYCNIITPTAQNLNMMELDITLLVNHLLKEDASKNRIVSEIEKLIRAYDPCFSCSTHFLKVKWL